MDQTGRLRGWEGDLRSLYTSFTTVASNFTTESALGRKMFSVRQHRIVDSLGSNLAVAKFQHWIKYIKPRKLAIQWKKIYRFRVAPWTVQDIYALVRNVIRTTTLFLSAIRCSRVRTWITTMQQLLRGNSGSAYFADQRSIRCLLNCVRFGNYAAYRFFSILTTWLQSFFTK